MGSIRTQTATYSDRDITLRSMGYQSYQQYLASALWAKIRIAVLAPGGVVCRLCYFPARVVHHTSYSRAVLEGLDLSQLIPLCHGCHKKVEFTRYGEKRTLGDAQLTFKELAGRKKLAGFRCVECGRRSAKRRRICRPCKRQKKSSRRKHYEKATRV